ncbi:MAG: HNH endonuclease [Selenomonadaceae bacterium]|nr:HNH endonuclease [Selenomonadaceae bacterium]
MPQKPKRPCRYKGCPKLVSNTSGYCEEHEKLMSKHYDKFIRSPEHNKRYGHHWRKIRARFIKGHLFCESCFAGGKYVLATEVHHIKPLSEGGKNDTENLMALCSSCHAKIHSSKK